MNAYTLHSPSYFLPFDATATYPPRFHPKLFHSTTTRTDNLLHLFRTFPRRITALSIALHLSTPNGNFTETTYRRQQLRRCRVRRIGQVRGELDAGAEIKVTDLDWRQLVLAHAQNILRLQVPVRDPLLVQKVQSRCDLLDDLGRIVLREAHVLLDARQQRAAIDLDRESQDTQKN